MRKAQAPHLINKNRVGDRPPTLTSLTRDVDDGDILDAGANRIPSLLEGNAAQNNGIAGDRPGVVMRKVIVAHCHGIRLNTRRYVEVRIGDDFGLAA